MRTSFGRFGLIFMFVALTGIVVLLMGCGGGASAPAVQDQTPEAPDNGESGGGGGEVPAVRPVLTVSAATDSPPARYEVMGTTMVTLAKFRMSANNFGDLRVTDVRFAVEIENQQVWFSNFQNLRVMEGGTLLGGPASMSMSAVDRGEIQFVFSLPTVVAKNSTRVLSLVGDVASFTAGAVSGAKYRFGIEWARDVTALVVDDNVTAVEVIGAPIWSESVTVYRTKPALTSSALGLTTGRVRTAVDDVANFSMTAHPADQLELQAITLTFSGGAVRNGSPTFTVELIDPATGSPLGFAVTQTAVPGSGDNCSVTFSGINYTISAGTTKSFRVRVDSSNFANSATTSEALTVSVNAINDLRWSDGSSQQIPLEPAVVPFTVSQVSYE